METISNLVKELSQKQSAVSTTTQVQFFRLNDPNDLNRFEKLLETPGIFIVDEIHGQLIELMKFKEPSLKMSAELIEQKIKQHLGQLHEFKYGVWVYYPWSKKLVHILDEEEFVLLRTSRNQYKITPAEKAILATKKIGVIGLSVGQSVSVTLAMERVCGELRLADFDVLELTNLNRIRTGIHNLGLPKVYSVAREIAEIDPFIKVVCFPMGLTESNMDSFFLEGGKLDLLVEESDGFDIKILCRYKARELKVPVIMEASDRCMVDVERFDLEPNRSILHGLVDHLDLSTLKNLKTNEEKIPYMLDILGIETASSRLKASMLEIEQSITTWPQLASAVTMGGGITADVSRRLLLNQFNDSGRYHVDIEKLIGNAIPTEQIQLKVEPPIQAPTPESFVTFAKHQENADQIELSHSQLESIVKAACTAPSGGNAQPWRFVYSNRTLFLFNAFDANAKFLGYGNFASYIAFGAASHNIEVKASEYGIAVKTLPFPDPQVPNLISLFEFYTGNEQTKNLTHLVKTIDLRLTNRTISQREPIETGILHTLEKAASETHGAKLTFYTQEHELAVISDLLGELEKIRFMDSFGHRDFVDEIRWTQEENDRTCDGVDLRTIDLTNTEKVGLILSKETELINMLNEWKGGGAFKKLTRKSIDSANAIGIITFPGHSKETFLAGGKVLQRVWLEANALGISFQPVSASVFVYARLLLGSGVGLDSSTCQQLRQLRPLYEKTFNLKPGNSEVFIFRLCSAAEPKVKSLRKPLHNVFKSLGMNNYA